MPKTSKYPRLRTLVRKMASGQVHTYYAYDMRPEGKPDVQLGKDWTAALARWDELHNKKPQAKGRVLEAILRWREEVMPGYTNEETRRGYTRQLATPHTMAPKWTHRYEREPGSGKWVFVPSPDARVRGRLIKKAVEAHWKPPSFYFHLRRGGHVKAIRSHQQHKYFLRLDIKDFFGSVSKSRVTRILRARFGYEEARAMAEDSTVKHPTSGNFILPYGFVQSPILASLALAESRLGNVLATIARSASLSVSVYMDDIIVSCNDAEKLDECKSKIEDAASKSLFALNEAKSQGPGSKITAFNIVLETGGTMVAEERMQKFVERYGAAPNGESKAGIRTYVHSINPVQANQFA